ncbi:MAG: hypothetical protein LBV03_06305 [Fusobacteriales bacterium]|jgi:hypothetical protein|nr:hypothetical protein [Fusobacteriales bacterium]
MKSKKALFLASLVLFLLSYTNNYAEKSQGLIIHREKLDFISGLNEEELKRLILKIKDIKKDNLSIDELKDLHDSYYTEVSIKPEDFRNYFVSSKKETEKIIYINKNEEIKNKKLQEVMERSLE